MKVDTTKTTDISGLGGAAVVNTQGIVHIKLTIGRGLVYVFPIVVCDFGNTGFDAILGMDFLFRRRHGRREPPRIESARGEYVELHDQPVRYSRGYMNYVRLNRDVSILPGGSVVVPLPKLREGMPETLEYWVHRDVRWITTALNSENKPAAYKVTNVSERNVFLSAHTAVGAISAQGERPLDRPMVRTSSLKCQAWKAEAWEGSYPDDYRARLDEAAAELADDSSWKEPRPPSPRHLLTADGELRETCEVNDESSEGGRQPFADQAPGVPLSLTEAAKSKTPAVFCYHACHFRDTLPPPSILLMDTGFWVVRATKRARKVSAFICALGHFEWTRMAQGLKNAPMIYQRMITNALFGFVDMPPGVADEDADGEPVDMFALGFKFDLSQLPPPANRTSFADDISDGADSWTALWSLPILLIVELTDRILARLTYFGVSISALKSKFGKIATDFLGTWYPVEGGSKAASLDAVPSRAIPEPIYRELLDFGELLYEISDEEPLIHRRHSCATPTPSESSCPMYTTTWAISATVCQDYDGVLHPVRFCGRTLKGGEPRYEEWAKEALALLRAAKVCYYELRNMQLVVYSRHGLLMWILADKHAQQSQGCPGLPTTSRTAAVWSRRACYGGLFRRRHQGKEKVGSYGFVIWQLPGWSVLWAENGVFADATVNLAEYNGLIAALERVLSLSVVNPVILAIRAWSSTRDQATGVEFHHVKREWNGAADLLAGLALQDRAAGAAATCHHCRAPDDHGISSEVD
ncbi:hypothetical protein Ae201684P_021057 [Aphanomyces euteiches]|nr:hypothetical protein Ae201684P_021057 [Aphanomyces euteiches]